MTPRSGKSVAKGWRGNTLLVGASVLFTALIVELVVFRFIFPATNIPSNAWDNGVIKYRPNQRGVYRIRNEIDAPFNINGSGWNSGHSAYTSARPGPRIAIVGDSYVEAFQVPFNASLAESLEAKLTDLSASVYRYGISGAPLSQYVWMVEKEVLSHRPDLIVVVLVHNDFDESYQYRAGRYTSSFLKLKIKDGRVVAVRAPDAYRTTWKDWIRDLATVRFLYYQYQVTPSTVRQGLKRLFARKTSRAVDSPGFEANISVPDTMKDMDLNRATTAFLLNRLKKVTATGDVELLVVMDGHRQAIYKAVNTNTPLISRVHQLNDMVAALCQAANIDFIDLTPVFLDYYRRHKVRFEHEHDNHWNQTAHELVAKTIETYFRSSHKREN